MALEFSFLRSTRKLTQFGIGKGVIRACKGIGIISENVAFKVHFFETSKPENNYLTALLAFLSQVFAKLTAEQLVSKLFLKLLSRSHEAKLPDWQAW